MYDHYLRVLTQFMKLWGSCTINTLKLTPISIQPWTIRSNNLSCPTLTSCQLKCSAYCLVADRFGNAEKSILTAAAIPSEVRLSIRQPASGAATTSGLPQTFDAITGVPHAIASSSTLGQPSRLDANTRASADE